MDENLSGNIVNATKWSAITEVIAKLIAPITSMVLARVLTPEAFGVVATLNMVIAFAEIFTDAGFQRFLIQHKFSSEQEKDEYTNVAFWSNLTLSFVLWGIIVLLRDPISDLVGSPGMGIVLSIACFSIPLVGFSSIQIALFKRELDFKTIFYLRLVSVLIPLVITIPLAIILKSYWALVIGTIASNLATAILLSIKSPWKPRLFFRMSLLGSMFSFCAWSIVDSVLVWATSYADIFFIGKALSQYYLGLYKTSTSIVGQITSLITAMTLPVIMPSLSKLQDDYPAMRALLLKFQKYTGIVLIPLGAGIFLYREFITSIMLGSQWTEAAGFLGLWGLMDVITIIFARFCSPVYPAIGKPRVSAIVQVSHLIVLIPAIIISGQYGFKPLYITRSLIRIELVIVNLIAVYIMIRQSPWKMIGNVLPEFACSLIMAAVAIALQRVSSSIIWSILSIIICSIVYFVALYFIFPKERDSMNSLYSKALSSIKRK